MLKSGAIRSKKVKYLIVKLPTSSEIFDLSKNQESLKCVFGMFGGGLGLTNFI